MTPNNAKLDAETLERALMLACERVADSPQSYEEANSPEGWFETFVNRAAEQGEQSTEKLRM